jgi:pimeloyl-ACP methyl ester carboxylesterase
MRKAAAVATAAVCLAGCGSSGPGRPLELQGPFGKDAGEFWLVRAEGKPKAVVAVLHGLSQDSGLQYQQWLLHLAEKGDDVVYPRYEQPAGDPNARNGVVAGVRAGVEKLGDQKVPLVLVGHSRGGRLGVEAAAFLHPAGVVAVEPGQINPAFEQRTNLADIPRSTQIWLLVGDRDEDVGSDGAIELFERLRSYGVARAQIHAGIIRSSIAFTADHMAPVRADTGTRTVLWPQVDRLISRAASP